MARNTPTAPQNPVYRPQPPSGPQQPAPIILGDAGLLPSGGLLNPVPSSGQPPVTAPTVAYGGPMANSEVARSAPGTPQPGPAVTPSPGPMLTFVPSASPNQTLDSSDRAAVSGNPGVAGPIATVPTSQWQDFGMPMGQTVDQPVDGDTASSGS